MSSFKDKNNPFLRPKCFYDMEVYAEDWFICFEFEDGRTETVHNGGIMKILQIVSKYTMVGYNNYYYDDKMLTKIINGCTNPAEVKKWNDALINKTDQWWTDFKIVSLDAFAQIPGYPSLKKIESYNGSKVKETSVGFDIGRKLTPEELESEMEYCRYDVSYARKVYEARDEYWDLKEYLYQYSKDEKPRSFSWRTTSASSTKLPNITPTNELIIPDIAYDILPQDVIDLWTNGKTGDGRTVVHIDTKYSNVDVALGGIHGGIWGRYNNVILWDVQALYPSIMINYKMLGDEATISLKEDYDNRVFEKLQLKDIEYGTDEYNVINKSQTNKKLYLNTIYGLTGADWSPFYSNNLRLSVCIIGQVLIYDLILRLEELECVCINNNTDGVGFVTPYDIDVEALYQVKSDWEKYWNMVLSEEKYDVLYAKDVNNYIGIEPSGKIKTKGGFLTKHDILDRDFILDNYTNVSVNKTLVSILKDLSLDGEFNKLTHIGSIEDIKADLKNYDDSLILDYIGSSLRVINSSNNVVVYIPYVDLIHGKRKLSTALKDKNVCYIHGAINTIMTNDYRNDIENTLKLLSNFIRVELMEIFDKYGVLAFCSHISTNKAYNRFTTSLKYEDTMAIDGHGNPDELQKVNRYFVSKDGTPIYKLKPNKVLGESGSSEQLVAGHNLKIVNDDISEYDIEFTDLDVDYYVGLILQRLSTWVSNETEV